MRLALPMAPRVTYPDTRVDAVRGTVAVERGPLVYCLESVSLPEGAHVDQFILPAGIGPRDSAEGVTVDGLLEAARDDAWPYSAHPRIAHREHVSAVLVPYQSWANRGPGSMRIWLRHGE
ncbi:MAG: hypothetical protein J0H96_01145 [Microbacterium ginsengisoli]|nr:hypothetical protein [Microbacterium ginsengisoli]